MIEIKKLISEKIVEKIAQFGVSELDASAIADMLEYPPDANMGDLALP